MRSESNIRFVCCIKMLFLCLFSLFLFSCGDNRSLPSDDTVNVDSIAAFEYRWGICIDDYEICKSKILPNQLLSDILFSYGVQWNTISQIDAVADSTFSVRKLRANNEYQILQTKDSLSQAHYFIYNISPVTYVVYSFKDSVSSYMGVIPTDTVINCVSGSIHSSLWNSIIDNGASPELASMLSDIYSWTIDFFGIQKKDSFYVVYQELFAEGERVGLGNILASNFITGGKDHAAYYYKYRSDRGEYFDEKGNNLRRAFLKAPLSYSRMSSGFSNARRHPITKVVRPHHGVDYAAPSGTPVYSVGDGTVVAKGWDSKGGGNYIKIKHNSSYTTVYMHLKGFASGIAQGDRVKQNQLIGYVGATGLATGPHLDYRVFKDGTAINPLKMDLPAVDPIAPEHMDSFLIVIDQFKKNMRL